MLNNSIAPILKIDSKDYSPPDRFEAWRAEAQKRLLPFDLQCPAEERNDFFCRMTAIPNLSGIALVGFESSSMVATRDRRQIADGNDNYQFRLMQQGRMVLEMETKIGGRTEQSPELGSFSASLINNGRKNKGFHIKPINQDGRLLVISVPRTIMHTAVPNADAYLLKHLPGSVALLRFFGRYVNDLLTGRIGATHENAETLRDQLIELIAMIVATGKPNVSDNYLGPRASIRTDLVREFLGINFDNPELSLDDVAKQLRISSRSVQLALKSRGQSFSEILLQVRLEKAKSFLSEPTKANFRVSDIAFQCGFNDVSYFNRAFKAAFGLTPTDLRWTTQNQASRLK